MGWNYRIVKTTNRGESCFQIHEVYYSPNGRPKMMSKEPVGPMGTSLKELLGDFEYMRQALDRPVFVPPKKWLAGS